MRLYAELSIFPSIQATKTYSERCYKLMQFQSLQWKYYTSKKLPAGRISSGGVSVWPESGKVEVFGDWVEDERSDEFHQFGGTDWRLKDSEGDMPEGRVGHCQVQLCLI